MDMAAMLFVGSFRILMEYTWTSLVPTSSLEICPVVSLNARATASLIEPPAATISDFFKFCKPQKTNSEQPLDSCRSADADCLLLNVFKSLFPLALPLGRSRQFAFAPDEQRGRLFCRVLALPDFRCRCLQRRLWRFPTPCSRLNKPEKSLRLPLQRRLRQIPLCQEIISSTTSVVFARGVGWQNRDDFAFGFVTHRRCTRHYLARLLI